MFKDISKKLFALLLASAFALTACGGDGDNNSVDSSTASSADSVVSGEESLGGVKDVPAETALTVNAGGSYTIDKDLKGTVVIDTEAELELVLKNAKIEGTTGPAIYVKNCKKLTVKLEGENTLFDSDTYSAQQGELKGALFSEDDIVFTGEGSLSVTGNRSHAIASDDGITLKSGSIKVVSAVKDGVHANDFVNVEGGTLSVENAGGDAIESEADINITGGAVSLNSQGDCIKASLSEGAETDCAVKISGGAISLNSKEDGIQSDGTLDITGGTIDITTTGVVSNNNIGGDWGGGMQRPDGGTRPQRPDGGNRFPGFNPDVSMDVPQGGMMPLAQQTTATSTDVSSKGIKATGALSISGGTINVNSTDDALHSNGDLSITGGTFTLKSGDDGVHADGALVIGKANLTVSQSYEALEGKSVDIIDGTLSLTASDDGINAASGDGGFNRPGNANSDNKININGGSVYVCAGGDGVDSNGTLTVNGGFLAVEGSGNGNSAIDADGSRLINGGVVVAAGSGDMLENPQAGSKQSCAVLIVNSGMTAGSTVALADSEGKVIFCYSLTKSARSLTISAPELEIGKSYTLYTGVTPIGDKACGGLYYGEGVSFTGGTAAVSFIQSSVITQSR